MNTEAKGMGDVTVLLGGTIPEADIPALKKAGIAEIFLPGTSTQDIVLLSASEPRGNTPGPTE